MASINRKLSANDSLNDHCGYDYTLKFLLIGDNDVGKDEIFEFIDRSMIISNRNSSTNLNSAQESANNTHSSQTYKENQLFRSIIIDCDGCKIRLLMWSTSGQGRFNTVLRSFSRGAQGIVLCYDIANKWSFNSIEKWYEELETSLPGIPKILIGNRLHLAFKRQVSENEAKQFAEKRQLDYYEISPLCDYNVLECLIELTRTCLKKIRLFETNTTCTSSNRVLTLQELCVKQVLKSTTYYGIEHLPLPNKLKKDIKMYLNSHKYETTASMMNVTNEKYTQINRAKQQSISSPKSNRTSINNNTNSSNSNFNSPNINSPPYNVNNLKLNYKTKKNSTSNSYSPINLNSNNHSKLKNCNLM